MERGQITLCCQRRLRWGNGYQPKICAGYSEE